MARDKRDLRDSRDEFAFTPTYNPNQLPSRIPKKGDPMGHPVLKLCAALLAAATLHAQAFQIVKVDQRHARKIARLGIDVARQWRVR